MAAQVQSPFLPDNDTPMQPSERCELEAFEDASRKEGGCCAECFAEASLRCPCCDDEFYCGIGHMEAHRGDHISVCVPKGASPGFTSSEDGQPAPQQDGPLVTLPWHVLLAICRHLKSRDLVRLGWVCGRLREVSRTAAAWSRVKYPDEDLGAHCGRGVLRIAPALHSLSVIDSWPTVNLTRCTSRVRELELGLYRMTFAYFEMQDKVIRLLNHYQGHLQVVKLCCLGRDFREDFSEDLKLLRAIDRLDVEELYVGHNLLKVYPRSHKVVTHLEVGEEVSGPALADALYSCYDTLTSFKVRRADSPKWSRMGIGSPVEPALRKCVKLEELRFDPCDGINLIDAFHRLRSLSLINCGDVDHARAKRFFETSFVTRGLKYLSLGFREFAHRGLLKVAVEGCRNVRHLTLVYYGPSWNKGRVDVPRDLHDFVGCMGSLEALTLKRARVPSTVFDGLTGGALPNLRILDLPLCTVTKKGCSALGKLHSRRSELKVLLRTLQGAEALKLTEEIPLRCPHAMCDVPSDSEDTDPVPEVAFF